MKTFNGDPEMFHRVRLEVRKKTYEHSELRDPVEIQKQIFFAEDARSFLENNLISGRLQDNGRYRFKAKPQHSMMDPIKQ